jgi:hypothetical protein
MNSINNSIINDKMLPCLPKVTENIDKPEVCKAILNILTSFSTNSENKEKMREEKIHKYMETPALLSAAKSNKLDQEYSTLISNLIIGEIIQDSEVDEVIAAAEKADLTISKNVRENISKGSKENKSARLDKASKNMWNGKKVKMYKTDGSVSELLIFISSDLLELNCGLRLSEVVKQKWRLPLNEITKVLTYQSQESPEFMASVFEKNSGFFSKAPSFDCCLTLTGRNNDFYICFTTKEERDEWIDDFNVLKSNAHSILSKLR